jgi:hypothetical protein
MDIPSLWDSLKRNAVLLAIIIAGVWWLGRWSTAALETLALGAAVSAAATITAGIATWAYTRLDLVRTGDTSAISRIYLGVAICYGLVVLGNMVVMLAPDR